MNFNNISITEIIIAVILFSTVLPVFFQALRNISVYTKCNHLDKEALIQINSINKVSVIIPARNEEENLEKLVHSLLKSDLTNIEILIGNDHSTDATGNIAEHLCKQDSRVRHITVPELPNHWGGKMYACWVTAEYAEGNWLLFIDADVMVQPSAISRMLKEAEERRLPFLSGFPHEITGSFGERALIPMIFFILLGFLSIRRMRKSTKPAYAASCGQVMMIDQKIYAETGGHKAIKESCHDGLDMPRMLRRNDLKTDIVDLSDIIACRMYHSSWDTCVGLEKNAKYGLGSPRLIFVFTFMLIGGQILPWIMMGCLAFFYVSGIQVPWESIEIPNWRLSLQILSCALMIASGFLIRYLHYKLHRCSGIGALAHPIGVLWLLGIQWVALIRSIIGIQSSWRGRKIK